SQGLDIGSTEFVFRPGRIQGGSFSFDVGTAGSITLVLQALMPLLPFAPGKMSIEVRGGTDVNWSPPIDFLRLITIPVLGKMGFRIQRITFTWVLAVESCYAREQRLAPSWEATV